METNEINDITGINLALDPNLLSLPTHSATTTTFNSNANSPDNEESTDMKTEQSIHKTTKSESLIKNPFEVYGQVPLSQLIPLILQQKNIPFSELLESEIEEEIVTPPLSSGAADTKLVDNVKYEDKINTRLENNELAESPKSAMNDIPRTNQSTPGPEPNEPTLEAIRTTMVDQINTAMNESSLALETVSLLLSAVRENNAKSSLSPYLKRTIPLGSLNSERIIKDIDTSKQLDTVQFGLGWKLKSLDESRTILRDTLDSLWSIMEKEHSYWKMISEVILNSDVVFKVRDRSLSGSGSSNKVLGIKYGYEDSGSMYRLDRGIAILKNNIELNKLELIPFNGSSGSGITDSNITSAKNIANRLAMNPTFMEPKHNISSNSGMNTAVNNTANSNNSGLVKYFLRARILTKIESEDDYILSGESSIDPNFFNMGTIREQIGKFKNIIFEKELMYQLKKECSKLISYGVKIENENKIVIELPNEKFEIELITILDDVYDESIMMNNGQSTQKINDKRANLVLITLRILLVVIFKKNLRKRLTNNSSIVTADNILLIRPILGKLRHQNYKSLLMKIIKDNVLDIVQDCSINTSKILEYSSKDSMSDNESLNDEHIAKLEKDIRSFDKLIKMPITKFEIKLSDREKLIITLRTTNYCNAITNVKYFSQDEKLFDTDFAEFKEIEEFLHFIITEYVMKNEEPIMVKKEEN